MTSRLPWAICGLLLVLVLTGCDSLTTTQQRIDRARAAFTAGDTGRAAIELRKAVQSEPNNPQVRLLLARLSLAASDSGGAQGQLDRAVKAGAQGPEFDDLQVQIWLASNPSRLLDAITRGTISVSEPDRSIDLAHAYNALGQPDRAIAALAAVSAAHPQLTTARLAHAQALLLQDATEEALQEIEAVVAADRASVDAPLLKGQLLARQGRYAAAEQALLIARQRMTGLTPLTERASVLADITEARLLQGKLADASESHGALAKLLPDVPISQFLGARIKLARGSYSEGIADLERLVARVPSLVPARIMLGAAQLSQGNLMQAHSQLQQAIQQAPDNVEARKLLARVQLQLNQPDAALHILSSTIDANPTDPELYTLLEATQIGLGDTGSAIETLARGVRANPADASLKLDLAQAYLRVARGKDALALLQSLDTSHEDPRRDRLFVAAVYAVRGAEAASEEIDSLLKARPRDTQTLNLAASYAAMQWQFERARALLQQALAINAHDVDSLGNLARVDLATGDLPGAEGAMRTALATDAHNVSVRIALADILMRRGDLVAAQRVLESGGGDSAGPQLQLALGQLALVRGDLVKANAALDRAVASQPARADLVNQAGTLLLQARQYEAALARFRKAAALGPNNASYWLNVGRAQLALNQTTQAQESFEKSHQLKAQWIAPIAALALLDVRAKKFDSALARVRQALAKTPTDPNALVLNGDVLASAGKARDAAAAYAAAQRQQPEASTAVKLFQLRRAAALPNPEEPLQQWLALRPHDYHVHTLLGDYFLVQQSLRQAAGEFETVVEQAPADVAALNNLAWTYLQLNDSRAQSFAERAYRLAPTSPGVADTLGWVLAHNRATSRALPLLQQAAKAANTDPEIQYHYAYVLAQSGKRAEAREILTRALARTRDFASRGDAERLLADLKA